MTTTAPEATADEPSTVGLVAHAHVATGLGDGGVIVEGLKHSHVATTLARLLCEAGELDRVLVLADLEATGYWAGEFAAAGLSTGVYYHPVKDKVLRQRPQVLVSTHPSARPDLIHRERTTRSNGSWSFGPLAELCTEQTLVVFAGLRAVSSRASETHQGYAHWLGALRGVGLRPRVLGISKGPIPAADLYDLGRLFCPSAMPAVAAYEREFCNRKLIIRPDRVADLRARFGHALVTLLPEGS
jgi:hypothetical protein